MCSFKRYDLWRLLTVSLLVSATTTAVATDEGVDLRKALITTDPGLLSRQLSQEPSDFIPSPQASLVVTATQAAQKIPNAEHITFFLKKVTFTGNHAFSEAELQAYFQPFLQHKVTLAQTLILVNKINDLYYSKGYIFSKAILPAQTIKDGTLHIQIIEGSINHVKVSNLPPKLNALVERYATVITQKKPASYADVERQMLLINDIPGITAHSVLRKDPATPESAELQVLGSYQPMQASLSYDNYGSRYIGPNETTFNSALNSIFTPGGTFYTRAAMTTQTKELQFIELRNDQLIGSNGLKFSLGTNYADTNPKFTLDPLEIHGISKSLFSTLSYPFIRSRNENLSGEIELNYLNSSSSAFGFPIYNDRLRTIAIGANYSKIIAQSENNINLKFTRGFNIFGANNQGILRSRLEGVSDSKVANLSLSRAQYFNNRFSLYGFITSQYASSPLLAAQEMIFGGASLGRGLEVAQLSGDRGIAGTIEFRMNNESRWQLVKAVQYYTFLDSGTVWNMDSTSSPQQSSATTVGAGARVAFMNHLNGNFFLAKPLTPGNSTLETLHENSKRASIYFQLITYI